MTEKTEFYVNKNYIIIAIVLLCILAVVSITLFFIILVIILIGFLIAKFVFNLQISLKMNDDLTVLNIVLTKPSVGDIEEDIEQDLGKTLDENEVFNIPDNKYTYEDAENICKAYGANLATYSQVESAYNAGGEWCNYGWSQGQMALFPTQKSTYEKLQAVKGHGNDCGRPGVNGGFMENPYNQYGVNCYGKKPPMTDEEKKLMEVDRNYPPETGLDTEVKKWKKQINNILISPFNSTSWYKV